MDYSKVKFVTPSVDGKDFTKGKVYTLEFDSHKGGYLINNVGIRRFVYLPQSSQLAENPFIPCQEDGTPLTKEMTALEAEMLDLLKE